MQKWLILMILQKKTWKTQFKLHTYSWSPIQNVINLRFCIGKTHLLLNLINHQQYIDKMYLHAKDPYEIKY